MSEELSSELLAAVLQRLAEAESFDTVFKYERAVHFVIENFGSSDVATIQMLDKRVDLDVGAPDSRVTEDGTPAVLEFDHNRIDEEGSRAPLTFRTLSGRVYGEVVAPIVISTRQRRDYDLKLEIAMKTKLRDAWPSDWPNAEPGSIHVRHSDWRVHPEREGTYVFTFSLVVPTRQPKANDKISATLWAVDASTGAALSVQKSLSWDDVRAESAALTVDWPSSLRAQVVTEHPLGPQLHRDRIESRMENLASFAVVAPRRYGKSTLAAYLCDYLQQRDVAVVGDLLCTRHQERSGLNYEQLWASVSETLEAVVGATLAKERDGLLPAPKAFDRVRIAAKRSGKRAIALIVDEAQLLFDHRDGYMLGDRLKDALEREWSQATDEKVPVFLGLVGLPSLVQRGGANLMGLLSPFEHYELREADVQKLILKVTRNALHSTREARMRLANVSDNLYVLRKLLDGLAFRLADQGRCWAGYDDVVAVERELYQRLRAGAGEESLRKYVRDALNDADSVNEWRPAASYPLAVALARAKAQGHQRRARLKTACQLLNDWALSLAGDDRERLVFVEDALDDHLRVLADRGVYVSDDFRSQWSEAWLQGESSQGWPDDAGARRALVSSALTRIRVPRPLEPVGEGAQASVFLYEGENERLAVRKVPLATERQRRDFLESVQMLSTIRQPAIRRERGADCIFDLLNIGVMDDDDSHGVQIYRWVDGEDLGTKHHALPATLVVELGHQLALALQLLHANGILHRDIRPANIVVEDGNARPVLIDFGLARMSGSEMHTQVAHEFGAPEVQIPDPKWSPAADVFSLAVTLAWLCSPVDDLTKQVNDALWSSRSQEPGKRPSAAELARFLADLRKEMDVERRKTDARARLEAAVSADDRDKQWFRRVYDRFEPIFTAIILGLHGDVLDRASHAADFINQTLEACPSDGRYGQQLSLGQLKAVRSHEGVKISKTDFELMWALRTKRSHGSNKWSRSKIMRRFDSPAPQRIRDMALHVARATSEIIGVTSVLELVEIIVADGPN